MAEELRMDRVEQASSVSLPRLPWERLGTLAARLGIVAAILIIWQVGADLKIIDPFFWSKPSLVWQKALQVVGQGGLWQDTLFTFESSIIGFVLGTGIGAILGFALWWLPRTAVVVQPFIIIFHAVPKLALAPLVVLVFGLGLTSKVAMAIALTIVVSILTTFAGVQAVDRDLEALLRSLGAGRWQVFTKVVVPSVMPWLISALRIDIGLALAGAIVGELIASKYGLGHMILYASTTYDISLIWVGVFALSILAVLMYGAVAQLESWLLKGMHATPGGR